MALGASTFSAFGGGIADLYAASADRARGQGARIEAEQYLKSAAFADLNATYTKESTNSKNIKRSAPLTKLSAPRRPTWQHPVLPSREARSTSSVTAPRKAR